MNFVTDLIFTGLYEWICS